MQSRSSMSLQFNEHFSTFATVFALVVVNGNYSLFYLNDISFILQQQRKLIHLSMTEALASRDVHFFIQKINLLAAHILPISLTDILCCFPKETRMLFIIHYTFCCCCSFPFTTLPSLAFK